MTEKTRYVFKTKIVSVEERFRTLRVAKKADGTTEEERESLGWFIRLDQSSAISMGPEKPADWKAGDVIKHTMEKVG